jgi:hypothetical protein
VVEGESRLDSGIDHFSIDALQSGTDGGLVSTTVRSGVCCESGLRGCRIECPPSSNSEQILSNGEAKGVYGDATEKTKLPLSLKEQWFLLSRAQTLHPRIHTTF